MRAAKYYKQWRATHKGRMKKGAWRYPRYFFAEKGSKADLSKKACRGRSVRDEWC